MSVAVALPQVPVGALKRFGPLGPLYRVGAVSGQSADGDWLVQVTVIESSEVLDYRLSRLLADPMADAEPQ